MERPHAENFWLLLFVLVAIGYCLHYGAYGINETDGGFLSGLAWQIQCGKTLYADIVYVRPPLPVWLRALELQVFPEKWLFLGERWVFYLKVALYSSLGAAVLQSRKGRWRLALFAFIVSVHTYPAAAWHTVDGILFGVLSVWFWHKRPDIGGGILSGICLAATLLCKQSFYPMIVLWGGLVVLSPVARKQKVIAVLSCLSLLLLFSGYLFSQGVLTSFLNLSGGASSGQAALEHGIVDFFRIQPYLALITAMCGVLGFWWRDNYPHRVFFVWLAWLASLAGAYTWTLYMNRDFTAPFAQARLLFWLALVFGIYKFAMKTWSWSHVALFMTLLGLSWCASVSWGYNLPILFALPGIYAALSISERLSQPVVSLKIRNRLQAGTLLLLVLIFRYGYEFVYRDGPRSAMKEHLGGIFPALHGIYSTPQTAALYRDLLDLTTRYGPDFKTMPAFPQANLLAKTVPPLALDWVVEREMGSGKAFVERQIETKKPYYFVEKIYLSRLNDPELALFRLLNEQGRVVEETPHFLVIRF